MLNNTLIFNDTFLLFSIIPVVDHNFNELRGLIQFYLLELITFTFNLFFLEEGGGGWGLGGGGLELCR